MTDWEKNVHFTDVGDKVVVQGETVKLVGFNASEKTASIQVSTRTDILTAKEKQYFGDEGKAFWLESVSPEGVQLIICGAGDLY